MGYTWEISKYGHVYVKETSLHAVSAAGNVEMTNLLLKYGASLNVVRRRAEENKSAEFLLAGMSEKDRKMHISRQMERRARSRKLDFEECPLHIPLPGKDSEIV